MGELARAEKERSGAVRAWRGVRLQPDELRRLDGSWAARREVEGL